MLLARSYGDAERFDWARRPLGQLERATSASLPRSRAKLVQAGSVGR